MKVVPFNGTKFYSQKSWSHHKIEHITHLITCSIIWWEQILLDSDLGEGTTVKCIYFEMLRGTIHGPHCGVSHSQSMSETRDLDSYFALLWQLPINIAPFILNG